MRQRISDEELLDKLRVFYKAHGRAPAIRDFPGGATYEKRFGSWNVALQAAGLPINKPGSVSDEEMLAALQKFHREQGRSPTLDEFPEAATIEQRFGSWNKALQAAGLPPNKKNQIPAQDLLDRLRAFFHKHGRSPTYVELPGATTILTRFGGWNNALKAAKLPLNVPKYHLKKSQVSANTIRDTARVLYAHYHNGAPKQCQVCGYSKSVMICHIKPVAEFDDDATLEAINAKENLIALCPNCHHELDDGLLQLP
jgi:Homing endonuclease associated repeat/HNH endonuclease